MSLPRVADSDAQKAAEVEQGRRTERIEIVGVVEGVKYLDTRDELQLAIVKVNRTSHPEVEDEERIVFSEVVSPAVGAVHEARERV